VLPSWSRCQDPPLHHKTGLSFKVSSRSISDLERGINLTARKETARLLADALGLTGTNRTEFEAVARGRAAPSGNRSCET
jgi:hypothetical protein